MVAYMSAWQELQPLLPAFSTLVLYHVSVNGPASLSVKACTMMLVPSSDAVASVASFSADAESWLLACWGAQPATMQHDATASTATVATRRLRQGRRADALGKGPLPLLLVLMFLSLLSVCGCARVMPCLPRLPPVRLRGRARLPQWRGGPAWARRNGRRYAPCGTPASCPADELGARDLING